MGIKNQKGFTLIELIITIALISIALSLSGFGLSAIYNSNVTTTASRIVNDIKLVQTKEMASNDNDFKLIIGKSGNQYYVDIDVSIGGAAYVDYKHYDLKKTMIIKKFNTPDYDPITTAIPFEFNAASGKLKNGLVAAGRYQVSSTTSDRTVDFIVVEQNGRVYIDD